MGGARRLVIWWGSVDSPSQWPAPWPQRCRPSSRACRVGPDWCRSPGRSRPKRRPSGADPPPGPLSAPRRTQRRGEQGRTRQADEGGATCKCFRWAIRMTAAWTEGSVRGLSWRRLLGAQNSNSSAAERPQLRLTSVRYSVFIPQRSSPFGVLRHHAIGHCGARATVVRPPLASTRASPPPAGTTNPGRLAARRGRLRRARSVGAASRPCRQG